MKAEIIELMKPVYGHYGWIFRDNSYEYGVDKHDAVDIGQNYIYPFVSIADGKVENIRAYGSDNSSMIITHTKKFNLLPSRLANNTDTTRSLISHYVHARLLIPDVGDDVKQGEIIGFTGGNIGDALAGSTNGPHLHFGVGFANLTQVGGKEDSGEQSDLIGGRSAVSQGKAGAYVRPEDWINPSIDEKQLPKGMSYKITENGKEFSYEGKTWKEPAKWSKTILPNISGNNNDYINSFLDLRRNIVIWKDYNVNKSPDAFKINKLFAKLSVLTKDNNNLFVVSKDDKSRKGSNLSDNSLVKCYDINIININLLKLINNPFKDGKTKASKIDISKNKETYNLKRKRSIDGLDPNAFLFDEDETMNPIKAQTTIALIEGEGKSYTLNPMIFFNYINEILNREGTEYKDEFKNSILDVIVPLMLPVIPHISYPKNISNIYYLGTSDLVECGFKSDYLNSIQKAFACSRQEINKYFTKEIYNNMSQTDFMRFCIANGIQLSYVYFLMKGVFKYINDFESLEKIIDYSYFNTRYLYMIRSLGNINDNIPLELLGNLGFTYKSNNNIFTIEKTFTPVLNIPYSFGTSKNLTKRNKFDITQKSYRNQTFENKEIVINSKTEFTDCEFINCEISGNKDLVIYNSNFTDCVIKDCKSLSGNKIEKCVIFSCFEINGFKILNSIVSDSTIFRCNIYSCKINHCEINNVFGTLFSWWDQLIKDSIIGNTKLNNSNIQDTYLYKCDFNRGKATDSHLVFTDYSNIDNIGNNKLDRCQSKDNNTNNTTINKSFYYNIYNTKSPDISYNKEKHDKSDNNIYNDLIYDARENTKDKKNNKVSSGSTDSDYSSGNSSIIFSPASPYTDFAIPTPSTAPSYTPPTPPGEEKGRERPTPANPGASYTPPSYTPPSGDRTCKVNYTPPPPININLDDILGKGADISSISMPSFPSFQTQDIASQTYIPPTRPNPLQQKQEEMKDILIGKTKFGQAKGDELWQKGNYSTARHSAITERLIRRQLINTQRII